MPQDYFTLANVYCSGVSMKKAILICGFVALGLAVTGCQGKDNSRSAQGVQKPSSDEAARNAELALMFLKGSQRGDKNMMYSAANLTQAIVEDSRDKLVHPSNYSLSDQQLKACEIALRISGEIGYFSGKLRKLFPLSANIQVTKSEDLGIVEGLKRVDHSVSISYNDLAEAVSDKSGKPVKVMIVHLQQSTSSIDGRVIHSFSFNQSGFDKFVEKNLDVVSYY
jgi:hypothetical protein